MERCLLESLALKYRYVIEVGASGGGRDGVPVDHGVLRGPACDFRRSERHLEQRGFNVVGHLSEVSMTITAESQQSYVDALVERGVDVQNV